LAADMPVKVKAPPPFRLQFCLPTGPGAMRRRAARAAAGPPGTRTGV